MTIAILGIISLICGFIIKWVYRGWDREDKKTPEDKHKDELTKIETNFAKGDDKAISVDIGERLDNLRRVHKIQDTQRNNANNQSQNR